MSSAPRLLPSRRNCTPTTPTLSDAVAVTLIVPETVAPFAGAVSETVGAVVSGGGVSVVALTTVGLRRVVSRRVGSTDRVVIRGARRQAGVVVRRGRWRCDLGAVAEHLVAGDTDVIGACVPGQIDLRGRCGRCGQTRRRRRRCCVRSTRVGLERHHVHDPRVAILVCGRVVRAHRRDVLVLGAVAVRGRARRETGTDLIDGAGRRAGAEDEVVGVRRCRRSTVHRGGRALAGGAHVQRVHLVDARVLVDVDDLPTMRSQSQRSLEPCSSLRRCSSRRTPASFGSS